MLEEPVVRKGYTLLLPWLHEVLHCVTREEGMGTSDTPQNEKDTLKGCAAAVLSIVLR